MKIIFFRLAVLVLAIITTILIFSACEQEQIIEKQSHTTESQNIMAEDRSKGEFSCGTVPSEEQIEYLSTTKEARRTFSRKAEKNVLHYVPIANHIVRLNGGALGVSITTVDNAIQHLNNIYKDANIQFYACQPINYINNSAWYDFDKSEEGAMASGNDVNNVINIYYVNKITDTNRAALCGYAYMPTSFPFPNIDRVIIDKDCLNDNTLSHEMGHYFSLYHTHGKGACSVLTDELVNGSNCDNAGDDICDTPAEPCLKGLVDNGTDCNYTGNVTDANGDAFKPFTNNIMSYSLDPCEIKFSQEQLNRMAYSVIHDRNYLVCNAVPAQITSSFTDLGGTKPWDRFDVCVTPYKGTTHRFRYSSGSIPSGNWTYTHSMTQECFSIYTTTECFYNVQVQIKGIDGQWGAWSNNKLISCASIGIGL